MNRIPVVTRSHIKWAALLTTLLFFDMADLNALAYALPAIRAEWGLSLGEVGIATSATFLGMFCGSIIGGRLADRFGRKRVIIGATAFFSLFSMLTATATTVTELSIYRLLTGAGLQALVVVLLTYAAEMFPRQFRGRVQALMLGVSLLGVPALAFFSRWVVPLGTGSWRFVFIAGSAGVLVVILAWLWLPESPRWLEGKGRIEEAEKTVLLLEREAEAKWGGPLPEVDTVPAPIPASKPSDLIRQGLLRRTAVLAIGYGFGLIGYYGFNAWLPLLLTETGLTTAESLTYTSILSLAAVPGALIALLFIDKIERKWAVMMLFVGMGLFMLMFGFGSGAPMLLTSGLLITFLAFASTTCIYTYMPEIFPTHLRALGTGTANGIARLMAFGSTFILAAILGSLGFTAVMLFLAIAMILAGIVIGLLGERTNNRALEAISSLKSQEPTKVPANATATTRVGEERI
ncbi:MFS transporter [Pseudarthrobacter sulfonivorans]|uniref:MFS transporter n=1 Tax=Pseudarthrobacter sulfonivorans TaxID=121292 RepID=A0A0U3PGZ3_9MICC|nr:MFS transporter [Pseudarthrobacter sulfonivorans]